MYADWEWYALEYGGTGLQEDVEPELEAASDAIDALTFSRIHAVGWDRLTDFQKGCVRMACCAQADFALQNADAVQSAMTRYSINGVTMEFGNAALYTIVDGQAMSNRALGHLRRSGLMSLMAYPPEVDRALA